MPDRTPFTRHRRTRQLDAYWDSVVEGDGSMPIVPVDVDRVDALLVRRMQSLASSPTPGPDFAARLEQNLMNTYISPAPSPLTEALPGIPQRRPDRPSSSDGTRASAPVSRRRTLPPPSRTGWSLRPAVAIGLAILLILASVGGIWMMNNGQDEPHRLMAPEVATPSADASPGVPMYRANPERTGVMPGPGIDGQPVELWRAEVQGSIETAPALVDDVLYVGVGDGGLYAYDAASGEGVWVFQGASPIMASPAVHDGIVYVGSTDGTLYAIDAAAGTEVWTFPGAQSEVAVVIVDNVVYTGGGDGFLYALDAATGEEVWRASLDADAARSPAVSDGVVYMGSSDGVLHTFDADTGEPGWARQLQGGDTITTTVVHKRVVYQGSIGGAVNRFFALDAATGGELWSFDSESGGGFFTAATDGITVYTVSDDTNVYALDAATGNELWRFETNEPVTAAPALVDATLYVGGNDGILYAIDAGSGEEIWRFQLEGTIGYGPVVANGVAYVGTLFGYFYAIGGNGEPIAATPAATPIASPVAPAASPVASTGLAEFLWEIGQDTGLSGQPSDVTIAPDGTIWTMGDVLHLLDPDGSVIETWAGPEPYEGALHFDRDGNLYIVDTPNHRVLKFGRDRELLLSWGSQGDGDGQFEQAGDLVIDSEGNVYIGDAALQRIQKFGPDGAFLATISGPGEGEGQLSITARLGIDRDDNLYVPDGSHVEVFASDGTFLRSFGAGHLGHAVDATVDDNGNVYVSDAEQNQIQVYDPDGNLLGSWGAFGREPGNFIEADALALDGLGNLYVVDFGNERIQKFALTPVASPDATPVAADGMAVKLAWQSTGGPDPLIVPTGMTIGPDGKLWIVDSGNNQFQILSRDGVFLETWGEDGDGEGELTFVRLPGDAGNSWNNMAFAPDGSFYVAEPLIQRIQHFAADRTFIGAWGSRGTGDGQFLNPSAVAVAPDGNVYVIDDDRNDIQVFGPEGTYLLTIGERGNNPGQLNAPGSVTIAPDGTVYVADYGNHRIQQFTADGTFNMTFGEFGREEGQFTGPADIAIGPDGNLYITEPELGRVQVFTPKGAFLMAWSAADDGAGALTAPVGITVDADGNVYVADMATSTVQKFEVTVPKAAATPVATP